jgi:hypothetical protein
MPNKRKAGQTFIGCQADEELKRDIDMARGRRDRSLYIREAIAEKLRNDGFKVSEDLVYPPDRAGNTAKIHGDKNTVTQTFRSTSSVPASAKYPKPKRGRKKKPPEK